MREGQSVPVGVGLRSRSIKAKKRFLAELASCGVVVRACEASGVPIGTVYGRWRRDDVEFLEAMDRAVEVGRSCLLGWCESEVVNRARAGSDGMLYFLTKKLDPSYKDNFSVNVGVVSPGSVKIALAGTQDVGDSE